MHEKGIYLKARASNLRLGIAQCEKLGDTNGAQLRESVSKDLDWAADIIQAQAAEIDRLRESGEIVRLQRYENAIKFQVLGWRERDRSEWWCRRTAEEIADDVREALGETND